MARNRVEVGVSGQAKATIGESIFTQADSLQEVREMIKDAVRCHYPDEPNRPQPVAVVRNY